MLKRMEMQAYQYNNMFEHYKSLFYGATGWTWLMLITPAKGVDLFITGAIGAVGAWAGTQMVKLIVKSWKKSWKPMITGWRKR